MFKAPIHRPGHLLSTASRINKLAEITQLKHSIDLICCINVSMHPRFDWNRFLRNSYLALNRLPEDDVEAHHIKNMLTKAVDMFNNEIPFHPLEASTTMLICDKLEDWEADVLAGKIHPDDVLQDGTRRLEPTENNLRLKFRLDVSRDIGLVPMQELHRALETLPFDIELTSPLQRATVFEQKVYVESANANMVRVGESSLHRTRVAFTFTSPIGELARSLIVERMLERKLGAPGAWRGDELVFTRGSAGDKVLSDSADWRRALEEELTEVINGLTSSVAVNLTH
ncbi:hypothetical protein pEaSNUABM8_00147 [Erwinia phage pEa_SNUABM_8]|nr:hypothetical protein pEaSNUABM8_00147 [Erwinia phage pEa_SNUABM_8]QVW54899.1 hypothetical protein pEaSNUABM4_00146 [Erwinia phage pEa_SNUABM_4]